MDAPLVLVIDDERGIRRTLQAFLEDEGMQVATATSGEDAVKQVRNGVRPDVCVVDVRLPGIDGHDTVVALHKRVPAARFIIYTGSSDYGLPIALRECGVESASVFKKPLEDLAPLVDRIQVLAAAVRGTDAAGPTGD